MTQNKSIPRDIPELTAIRFFAALHVVFFHLSYVMGPDRNQLPPFLNQLISHGDAAVTFFFLLSGFILSYVYFDGESLTTTPRQFWVARFAKIYPLYFVALILDLPRGLGYFFSKFSVFDAIVKTITSFFAHTLLLQSWVPRLTPAWNPPGWSISTEAFFYVVFPFIVLSIHRRTSVKILIALNYILPVLIFYLLSDVMKFNLNSGSGATLWRSFPIFRICDFILGICLANLVFKKNVFRSTRPVLLGVLFWASIILSLSGLLITTEIPRDVWTRLLLLPLFSFMIMIPAVGPVWGGQIFRLPITQHLGRSSYALYILHIPWFYYFDEVRSRLGFGQSLLVFTTYLASSLIISSIFFTHVEVRLQRKMKNFFKAFAR